MTPHGFSHPIISQTYQSYLSYLKDLIAMPSVFTDPAGIERAIQYCRDVIEKNLPEWQVSFDAKHNLIACLETLNTDKAIVYLSAHVDTVDADASEWDGTHSPFEAFEDEREIRGRGASDCKAGVAYQLFLSHLHARGQLRLDNVVLTVTFNEEGSGDKTATEMGRNLGASLPLSEAGTYLVVLENNVRAATPPILCVYDRERGNYVIKTRGTLSYLQTWLRAHPGWNPVCIYPDAKTDVGKWNTRQQESRHVCSVPREQNLLYRMILDAAQDSVLKAGQERNFGVVPASIDIAMATSETVHSLILSNRSFDTLDQVRKQLQGLSYEEMKPFAISQGLDVRQELSQSPLAAILTDCRSPELDIELTHNIGCSDASILYSAVTPALREKLLPIVMGPGTRSQPHAHPPRFTHGRNETFDKESAKQAMIYITDVLFRLQAVSLPSRTI
jgi:hypothetical protein